LKAAATAAYGFTICGLGAYCGELVNTEVKFYVSDTHEIFLMNDSHNKPNVTFVFFMSENEKGINILHTKLKCSLLYK
jgi:hypothetical protein